jgi:integrase
MGQGLRIYRWHTAKCVQGHPKGEGNQNPDCSCVLYVSGYLRNHLDENGKPKRIRHRSLDTANRTEARRKCDEFLTWGQLQQPGTGLEALQGATVTIEDAVKFFFECSIADASKGRNTTIKYQQLLNKRLLPWCKDQGFRLIKRFDEAITVRAFFNSWRKRKNVDNNVVFEMSDTHLGPNTKRAMLERYRSFLTFCKENAWITANHAKKIKISSGDVSQKFAWDMQEYENILKTLEKWTDEYGRTGTVEAIRQHAYFLCLRYTGQRLSDVAMLGPDNIVNDGGKWFIALTQVKTGNFVKIPIQEALVRRLQALPLRGELAEPYSMKTNRRTYIYGTKFWFWSGESTTYNNAKEWGENIAAVLKRTEATFGKFKHKSTPHTARHFFAITMLAAGVPIEMVAKWLGHSSPLITARHYSHANSVFNDASHDAYSKAMEKIEGRAPKPAAKKLAIVKKKTG